MKIFICECGSLEHQLHIFHDRDDNMLYFEIHLTSYSFFKRLIYGIKYIFGYKSRFGAFDEILISDENKNSIIKELQ